MRRFRDRAEAGRALAQRLHDLAVRDDLVILGLPRGGVIVAAEVARALGAPVDAFVVRKLGVPGHEELAMGAIASGGTRVLNDDVIRHLGITRDVIDRIADAEEAELRRREWLYRGGRDMPSLTGRGVVLVDDGLATGASMRAAVAAVNQLEPARVIVAIPVAPVEACDMLHEQGAEVVCLLTPYFFGGVGRFYEDFSQTSDEEVRRWLGTDLGTNLSTNAVENGDGQGRGTSEDGATGVDE